VQASRNGIRVGDLVSDFDIFTEQYASSAFFLSLILNLDCTDSFVVVFLKCLTKII